MRISARSRREAGVCPDCSASSTAVHSSYQRRPADLPVGGQPVSIVLAVRRFFCPNAGCARRTFAEQFEGLVGRRRQRTISLLGMLEVIALAVAGRSGARMADRMAITVSRMTLLRLVRALPEQPVATPRVLGVDDFALLRGSVYASVLLDMDTHRPIEVLPDRTAETFAAWLRAHPGVEVICRDRAGAYAEGARTGAPTAIQVADRFRLWKNLGEAVESTVVTHRACLREPEPEAPNGKVPATNTSDDTPPLVPDGVLDVCGRERRLVTRTRERFTAVQELRAQGLSLGAISRQLGLDHSTVRRYANVGSADELLVKAVNRTSRLDRFKPYINQRWNDGCTEAVTLHDELKALGWKGSVQTVRRYVHAFRATSTTPPATAPTVPAPPKPRRVVRWIMTNPDNLSAGDTVRLKEVFARCPELTAAAGHVRDFAMMMRELRGDQLDEWMRRVQADDLPGLHSFVTGIKRDRDAVVNGLTDGTTVPGPLSPGRPATSARRRQFGGGDDAIGRRGPAGYRHLHGRRRACGCRVGPGARWFMNPRFLCGRRSHGCIARGHRTTRTPPANSPRTCVGSPPPQQTGRRNWARPNGWSAPRGQTPRALPCPTGWQQTARTGRPSPRPPNDRRRWRRTMRGR
ncbi:ISL3 family transposase [Actinocrispum wychmicini]|uniref:Transposase n=1 Tax=Actinocrispum wychmicini TaxID=1213861 RepID=A0A4R2JFP8_9PSEU|nr:ISL3 family transposase [Actinocrispum wychmicini]TCO55688.1 transposase [Actinocrispum wychmicini]